SMSEEVRATRSGYVNSIDTYSVGLTAMHLGAGRRRIDSEIDYGVGIQINAKIGDYLEVGQSLCTVYYKNSSFLPIAQKRLEQAYEISERRPELGVLVKEIIE